MNTNHHKAVCELCSDIEGTTAARVERVLSRYSMSEDQLTAACEELFSGNDVMGASIGVAALKLTYPERGDDYEELCIRVIEQGCPLLRMYYDGALPAELEHNAVEMLNMIDDAAERQVAGFPLPI